MTTQLKKVLIGVAAAGAACSAVVLGVVGPAGPATSQPEQRVSLASPVLRWPILAAPVSTPAPVAQLPVEAPQAAPSYVTASPPPVRQEAPQAAQAAPQEQSVASATCVVNVEQPATTVPSYSAPSPKPEAGSGSGSFPAAGTSSWGGATSTTSPPKTIPAGIRPVYQGSCQQAAVVAQQYPGSDVQLVGP